MENLSADNTMSVDEVVNTYGDMLYRLCFIILKNENDAQDAVQETVTSFFEKKPQLRNDEHTKAWLISVAKNKCRDILRYKKRHNHLDIDGVSDIPSTPQSSEVLEVLMSLPEKFRLVLTLYYVEEYKTEEIARIIGKTPSAVKMRLQKGRRLLKEKYQKEVFDDEA